jgi:RNA polymerase sigma-70 factor (ECF subfamily)
MLPLVYDELRRLAARYMNRERVGNTLQTTALVNEAYLRLVDIKRVTWQNRAHFFALAAMQMRRILVDRARARRYQKRGGGAKRLPLDDVLEMAQERAHDLVALDDALKGLACLDERKSRVVEMRFFGGLSVVETAEVLGVSPDTVKRDWRIARLWLLRELGGGRSHDA